MDTTSMPSSNKVLSFLELLRERLIDDRDPRGQHHDLAFVVVGSVLAMMQGRTYLSSICRFMHHRLDWLREACQLPVARAVSRAQLPRMLARLNLQNLRDLAEAHFGRPFPSRKGWIAVDGKALRGCGSGEHRQAVVLAICQETGTELGSLPQSGNKSSEAVVARRLLGKTGLAQCKVTLDALHCSPATTAFIHQAGGAYLVQVKNNQAALLEQCEIRTNGASPRGHFESVEKAHGRHTVRRTTLFALRPVKIAKRWNRSGLQTLVRVYRETLELATGNTTREVAYYVSNAKLAPTNRGWTEQAEEMAQAVRGHWAVESHNWVRDTAFKEDTVRVSNPNQAQSMACLRGWALSFLRTLKTATGSFTALQEMLSDIPKKALEVLRQGKFL